MLEIKDRESDYSRLTPGVRAVVILCSTVVLITCFYFGNKFLKHKSLENKPIEVQENKNNTKSIDNRSADEQLKYLNSRNLEKVPSVTVSKGIKSNTLPVPILSLLSQVFISDSKSVDFDDGSKGYEVVFYLGNKIEDDYLGFVNSIDKSKWNVVKATYTENAGLLKIENLKYKASLEFVQKSDLQTKVKMTVIVK